MSRIIAIDPAIRKTGYAVIEGTAKKQKALDYGFISFLPKVPHEEALTQAHIQIYELIQKWTPEEMAIESIIFVQSKQSAIYMGSARASAMIAAGRNHIPVFQYAPNKVKKALLGRGQGKASKEQVSFLVRALLGISEPIDLDASDALAVGICHLQNRGK